VNLEVSKPEPKIGNKKRKGPLRFKQRSTRQFKASPPREESLRGMEDLGIGRSAFNTKTLSYFLFHSSNNRPCKEYAQLCIRAERSVHGRCCLPQISQ
uniref:3',5'-cyclic-GMP phosphodiesterase n=1 Tax=Pygocentrus nattereri TaxID=42514 RepID=A0A3B4DWE8_PYGNA